MEDLTHLICRSEKHESRFGIEILSLYATWDEADNFLEVNGELLSSNGGELPEDLSLRVAIYDRLKRIVGTEVVPILAADFLDFKIFQIQLHLPTSPIFTQIRIFPEITSPTRFRGGVEAEEREENEED